MQSASRFVDERYTIHAGGGAPSSSAGRSVSLLCPLSSASLLLLVAVKYQYIVIHTLSAYRLLDFDHHLHEHARLRRRRH